MQNTALITGASKRIGKRIVDKSFVFDFGHDSVRQNKMPFIITIHIKIISQKLRVHKM